MNKTIWRQFLALTLALVMAFATPATAQAAVSAESSQIDAGSKAAAKTTNYYTKKNLRLMTAIIFCEARGESYKGQLAVGMVVMNRVHSDKFPDTIREVIYQKGQFSPVKNGTMAKALKLYDAGKFTEKEHLSCIKAAKYVLKGKSTLKLNGKVTDMTSYLFFSVYLKGSRLKIGNHNFK